MTTHDDSPDTVLIGGKQVPCLLAALMAQEADRRELPPGEVGEVAIPDPAPTHVELAGKLLTVFAAASIAADADAQGVPPRKMIEAILEAHIAATRPPST